MNKDITQDQITEARDWASDCLGMVAATVTFNRALKYITANYEGGWDAFVAEVCVDALVQEQHLTAETAVEGQPVTIRKYHGEQLLQEYAGTFSRVTRNGYLRCREDAHGTFCDYRPAEVYRTSAR